MRITACITLTLLLCAVGCSQAAEKLPEIPKAWQTDPSDKAVPVTVSDEKAPVTLTWMLKEAVPAGAWLRVCGSRMPCAMKLTVDHGLNSRPSIPK